MFYYLLKIGFLMLSKEFDIPRRDMVRRKATTLLHKLRLLHQCYMVFDMVFYNPENHRQMSYRKRYRREGRVFPKPGTIGEKETRAFSRYEILPSSKPNNIILKLIWERDEKITP